MLLFLLLATASLAAPRAPGIHVPHKKIGACSGPKFPFAAAKKAGVAITAVTRPTTAAAITTALSSASGTLIHIPPGQYNFTTVQTLKAGVSIQCECGATLTETGATAALFQSGGSAINNVIINNCMLTTTGTAGGNGSGLINVGDPSSAVYITHNTIRTSSTANGIYAWDFTNSIIANNDIGNAASAEYQGITFNTGTNDVTNNQISDNYIHNMTRMAIETQYATSGTHNSSNQHFDRNYTDTTGDLVLSIVGNNSNFNSGTIWGNVSVRGASNNIEAGTNATFVYNMTISNNIVASQTWGMLVGNVSGSVWEGNYLMVPSGNEWSQDGGYVATTEWIGTNYYLNGSAVSGWASHGPYTGAGPTRYAPSQPIAW